jgi:secretion/DNA translocation related CpaE-like protein
VDAIWPVIGVVGGRGGAGASTFAAVLAAMAGLGGRAVLVDLDPVAGGLDVLLGVEGVPGARWSGLRLDGGRLDAMALLDGLPPWGRVAVLSADLDPAPAAVAQVLDVAARAGPVVVDLGRWSTPWRAAALDRCALVVLVCGADVRSVTGARAVRLGLGTAVTGLVVVRAGGAAAPASRVAELVDMPLIGAVPAFPGGAESPLAVTSLPRAMSRVARGVLDAVQS